MTALKGERRLASAFIIHIIFEDGQGVPQDEVQAVAWFRKAIEGAQLYIDDEFCRLEDEIYKSLLSFSRKNLSVNVVQSSEKGINKDGMFYKYPDSVEQGTLDRADNPEFSEAFVIKENAELYYLKARGGMCKVSENFLVEFLNSVVFYKPALEKRYLLNDGEEPPKSICFGRDQMLPTPKEEAEIQTIIQGKYIINPQEEFNKIFKFGFR